MKRQLKSTISRFDTKLPKEQKDFFEYAASLGGFRTLTDFVISSAMEKADAIIKQKENLISSENDRAIFFNALMNPTKPNKKLVAAAKKYKSEVANKAQH